MSLRLARKEDDSRRGDREGKMDERERRVNKYYRALLEWGEKFR
jgi:hypothetical protein